VLSQGKSSQSGSLEQDPRWQLTQRIAGSVLFQRSPRLRALLIYVCESALHRPGEALNEHQIGCAVFERPPNYSPSEDNIVRVQARHLRARLEEYFQNEGREEALILEIPKGGYLPQFRARAEAAPSMARETAISTRRGWLAYATAIPGAAVAGWYARGLLSNRAPEPNPSWILAALFSGNSPVRLVTPDSSFGLVQGYLGANLSLDDYLDPGYPAEVINRSGKDEVTRRRALVVASRPYTTYADVLIASEAAALAQRHGWKLTVSFPRQVTPRDLESGNSILVGSSKSNPWSSLFEQDMNFQSFYDLEKSRGGVRNRSPLQGEAAEYVTEPRHGYSGEAYALVGLHIRANTRVLTLAGTNMEGTEAAWAFIASPERAQELAARAGWRNPPKAGARLEVILRTHVLAGSARDTRIVAIRQR
jgi:hypothetical protein